MTPITNLNPNESTDRVTPLTQSGSESLNVDLLSVAIVGPQDQRRRAVASALTSGSRSRTMREFASYPSLDEVNSALEPFDVVIIDLDSDPEQALDLIETLCVNGTATVMVYSGHSDPELLVRCMRAGAREFLSHPLEPGTLAEAMIRASVRRQPVRTETLKRTLGRLFVFTGAKGGSGVSTLATNYAVAAARDSGHRVLLLDLHLPLGGVALDLGVVSPFSTANALQSIDRLDSNLLSTLLIKHSSGLFVLPAPDRYTRMELSVESITKLVTVARQDFDFVVVDIGSNFEPALRPIIDGATTIYLVTQVGVSQLRNANRMITEYLSTSSAKLEVVLNRFSGATLGIDDAAIAKALTVSPNWKIPNDYQTVQRAHNTATPFVSGDSAISNAIRKMVQEGCGLKADTNKRKRFGLFG